MWPFGRRSRDEPLGRRGERLARRFLKHRGMKVLAANYRCPGGEVDIIALDPSTRKQTGAETIAFVEVKTRTSDRYTDPESAVNADKRRRLEKVADYYLATHQANEYNVRFDIVAVVIGEDRRLSINYIPDAF